MDQQYDSWNSPTGVNEGPSSFMVVEPIPQVDQTTLDVLGIFDEAQALVKPDKIRYHLFDQIYPKTAMHLPTEMNEDDYSEESLP